MLVDESNCLPVFSLDLSPIVAPVSRTLLYNLFAVHILILSFSFSLLVYI